MKNIKILTLFVVLICSTTISRGQTVYSSTDGEWASVVQASYNIVLGNTVNIQHVVEANTQIQVLFGGTLNILSDSLIINAGLLTFIGGNVTINTGAVLYINGNLTNALLGDIIVNGTLKVTGDVDNFGSNVEVGADGYIGVGGDFTNSGGGTVDNSAGGNIAVGGTIIPAGSIDGNVVSEVGAGAALPVKLLSFTGIATEKGIELDWTTATEIDNDYFEIQRSIDAKTFVTIGKVYGAGNSRVKLDYTFIDKNPNNGTSYYRLKQVDYDGTSEDHNSISVTWNGKINDLDSDDISIYPNPYSGDELTLDLQKLEPNTSINLSLVNLSGKLIYKEVLIIPENQQVNIIPSTIDRLSKGIYLVNVQTVNKLLNKKLIVK